MLKTTISIGESNYPECLGVTFIVNTSWTFSSIWSMIKGWLDENTRKKVHILSGDPIPTLTKYIDIDQIPDFLGGNCKRPLSDDHGPWDDFELIDGNNKDDIVGIRRKSDGPNGKIFTPKDFESLPNYLCEDPFAVVEYTKLNKI